MRRHASKRSHRLFDKPVDHDWVADVGYVIFAAIFFAAIAALPIALLAMCSAP